MLVFGAICPHPPILIPSIGKGNLVKIRKTKKAMKKLADDFYHTSPETVIVISPHGPIMAENFSINHSPELVGDFSDFGDLDTKLEFKNDIGFAYQLRESIETKFPVVLLSEQRLDHGVLVPLYYLTEQKKGVLVIPIGYSLLDNQTHYNFGRQIGKIINQTNKRLAVVASGDLSHRLTKDAPAGYSAKGKEFDQKLISLLKAHNIQDILNLDSSLVEEAGECGFRSILIILGILNQLDCKFDALSYEGPFGVGYLTANFKI